MLDPYWVAVQLSTYNYAYIITILQVRICLVKLPISSYKCHPKKMSHISNNLVGTELLVLLGLYAKIA